MFQSFKVSKTLRPETSKELEPCELWNFETLKL